MHPTSLSAGVGCEGVGIARASIRATVERIGRLVVERTVVERIKVVDGT